MTIPLVVEQSEGREPSGVSDGGHILLRCSNCRAILMDLWRTRPQEAETWKVRANCPWCGDRSFTETIRGGFHPGGYGRPKADDETDEIPSTILGNCDVQGDTYVFEILKANENARPILG